MTYFNKTRKMCVILLKKIQEIYLSFGKIYRMDDYFKVKEV